MKINQIDSRSLLSAEAALESPIYKDTATGPVSQPIFENYAHERLSLSPLHKVLAARINKDGINKTGD